MLYFIMTLLEPFRKLLAALAIVGLIAGGAVAAPSSASASPDMTMDGDMPCCPDKTKPDCGANCPLMILCGVVGLPAAPVLFSSTRIVDPLSFSGPLDDDLVDGLGASPPRRPPRI